MTDRANSMAALQSAVLWRQKIERNAKLALSDLDDETLALVVADELRRRPMRVVSTVMDEVCK